MNLDLSVFWLVIVAMTLLALLFVLVPFVRFTNQQSYRGLKSQWYKTRLQEIELEKSSGKFDQAQYEAALTELKLTAADELKQEQNEVRIQADRSSLSKKSLIGLSAFFLLVTVGFYYQYGHFNKLENWQNVVAKLPELSGKVVEGKGAAPTEQDYRDFSLALRTRLKQDPQPIGWMLLGRNLMMLGDIDGAIDAFDKSFRLESQNMANLLSLAQALQQRGEPGDYARSVRLLQSILSLNPNNLTALILLAEGRMLNEDLAAALEGFNLSLRFISPQDPRKAAIEQRVAFLRSQLSATDEKSKAGVQQADTSTDNSSEKQAEAGGEITITVSISLAENVKAEQYNALFVFAKMPGNPMPLAVKKLSVDKLSSQTPLLVTLSEQDVMLPTMSLSKQTEVDIFVTLSLDDAAPFEQGDLQAEQKSLVLPAPDTINLILAKE